MVNKWSRNYRANWSDWRGCYWSDGSGGFGGHSGCDRSDWHGSDRSDGSRWFGAIWCRGFHCLYFCIGCFICDS